MERFESGQTQNPKSNGYNLRDRKPKPKENKNSSVGQLVNGSGKKGSPTSQGFKKVHARDRKEEVQGAEYNVKCQ